jgi:phenylacetate-CoA ligase
MKFPASAALFLFKNKLYTELHTSLKLHRSENEDILKYQNDKFVKLLKHAKENVPYYSEILNNVFIINDIQKIPFLTKSIIKERKLDLKAKNYPESEFVENSTSGSTGESMHFYSDRNDKYSEACAIRGDMLTGWEYGERNIVIWGAARDIRKIKNFSKWVNQKYVQNYKILSSFDLSEQDVDDYIKTINAFRPALIIGYPTALFLLANHILKYNKQVVKVKGVISAGETLYEFQREIIEKAFHNKVFNRYGCRDVYQIASECEAHNGLHISADHVIVEIVDEKGEPVKPGEMGEIVVTDLDNFAFPIIRYKIGDIGVLKDPGYKCSCGINLPMLDTVEGRTMDIIVGTNGNRLSGNFWTLFFRHNFSGIEKFQVIQETKRTIILYFEVNGSYNALNEITIKNEIRKKLGDDIDIEINIVDKISKTATGKHKWIASKVSPYV